MAKTTAPAPVGARFVVSEETPFRVGAQLIANYLPAPHDYGVTALNCDFVAALLAEGKAQITGFGAGRAAGGTAITG